MHAAEKRYWYTACDEVHEGYYSLHDESTNCHGSINASAAAPRSAV